MRFELQSKVKLPLEKDAYCEGFDMGTKYGDFKFVNNFFFNFKFFFKVRETYASKDEQWKVALIKKRKREDHYVRRSKPWSKRIDHSVHQLKKMELEERYHKAESQMAYEIKRAKTCWTPG